MLPETAAFFRPFAANVFWVEPVQSDNTGEILSIANYFRRSAPMRIDYRFAGTARNPDKTWLSPRAAITSQENREAIVQRSARFQRVLSGILPDKFLCSTGYHTERGRCVCSR